MKNINIVALTVANLLLMTTTARAQSSSTPVGSNIIAKSVVVMPHEFSFSYSGALGRIYRQNNGDPQFVAGDITSDPTAYFEPVMVRPEYLMASNNGFNLWQGTNNAPDNFARETGMMLGFPFVVSITNGTFSLADLKVYIAENGNPQVLNQTITYKNSTYGQARGELNGSVIDLNSPSTTPVDKLNIVIGVAYTVNSMATADVVRQHIAAAKPFKVDVTLELWSPDGSKLIARGHSSLSTDPLPTSPRLTIASVNASKIMLNVTNGGGLSYQLQKSTSLAGASSWQNIGNIDGTAPVSYSPDGGSAFFRLIRQ